MPLVVSEIKLAQITVYVPPAHLMNSGSLLKAERIGLVYQDGKPDLVCAHKTRLLFSLTMP